MRPTADASVDTPWTPRAQPVTASHSQRGHHRGQSVDTTVDDDAWTRVYPLNRGTAPGES
jgi:hypothetical protein